MLQNVNKLTPEVILDRCKQKTLDEFEYLRGKYGLGLPPFPSLPPTSPRSFF